MNIYIVNLSFATSEDTLKALFEEFGEVESVKVIKDRFSSRTKGCGFIEMPSNSEADQAIKALNGNRLEGNQLKYSPQIQAGNDVKSAPIADGVIRTEKNSLYLRNLSI